MTCYGGPQAMEEIEFANLMVHFTHSPKQMCGKLESTQAKKII